ncbi:fibrinogen-like protein A [Anopheles aquasalis]|uniref:fibrinogen-like protein A n=1 Tax=Anopheles aquasalis TaxID=42839 RepID=UPI00215B179C|nr:fibrinogen-like protein A [Anopheles aquasalis]
MRISVCFMLFCAALSTAATDEGIDKATAVDPVSQNGVTSQGLDRLLAKLEQIEDKLLDLQNELQEQRSNQAKIIGALQNLELHVGHNLTVLQDRALQMLSKETVCVLPKVEEPSFPSCQQVPSNVSGTYLIRINNGSETIKVFCEQEQFDGGWLVVQHRFDGSVDFHRNWTEYRDGFGDVEKEFWFGLERLYQLTTTRPYELLVEMKDFSGNYGYARYDEFEIASESEQYNLKTLGAYSGTAGDSMAYNRRMKFSTKDRDNDAVDEHCAEQNEGAWWHMNCYDASLNGPYGNVDDAKSIFWYLFERNYQGLSFTRMMIRQLK